MSGTELFFHGSEGQAIARWDTATFGNAETDTWRGRQVFTAGQTFDIESDGFTWDVTVSGYLLTNA